MIARGGAEATFKRPGGEATFRFCPRCGSSLFCFDDNSDEIEIKLGTLDGGPSMIAPGYELWTIRREHWLVPVDAAEGHERDRPTRS